MKPASLDQELEALKAILHALEPLDETQRRFVLKTVAERLGARGVSLPTHIGLTEADVAYIASHLARLLSL